MCGLVFQFNPSREKLTGSDRYSINNPTRELEAMFSSALSIATTRGEDSAGIMTRYNYQWSHKTFVKLDHVMTDWYKRTGCFKSASALLNHSLCQAINSAPIVAGHVRKATVGHKDEIDGAHPHQHENITLMHNGTLTDWKPIAKEHLGRDDFISDSQMLAHLIQRLGAKTAIEMVTGAKTLLWFDDESDTFNVFKSEGRTLGWVKLTNGVTLAASELWMAFTAAERKGFDVAEHGYFKDGTHYVYNAQTTELLETHEYVEKKPVAQSYSRGDGWEYYYSRGSHSQHSTYPTNSNANSNVRQLPHIPAGQTHTVMTHGATSVANSEVIPGHPVKRNSLIVMEPYMAAMVGSSSKYRQLRSILVPSTSLYDYSGAAEVDAWMFGLGKELANMLVVSGFNIASTACGKADVPYSVDKRFSHAITTNPIIILPVINWDIALTDEKAGKLLTNVRVVFNMLSDQRKWAMDTTLVGYDSGAWTVSDYFLAVEYYLTQFILGSSDWPFGVSKDAQSYTLQRVPDVCPLITVEGVF